MRLFDKKSNLQLGSQCWFILNDYRSMFGITLKFIPVTNQYWAVRYLSCSMKQR